MDIASELQVTQTLVKSGLFSDKEIQADFELYKICRQRKLQLSLIQVVLEKHACDLPSRYNLLVTMVQELEIPEFREQIDPYGMELGKSWEKKLAIGKQYLQVESLAKKALNSRNELKKYGLDFSIEHIALLMGEIPKMWDRENEQIYAKNKQIDLKHFCERSRNREFFSLNSPVFKISGKMLRMGDIQKALDLQGKLKKSIQLNIPIAHILIQNYQVESYFLHALLMAQMDCDGDEVSSWWGGMSLGSFKLSSEALDCLKRTQPYCERFLESCFQTAWLEFEAKKEVILLEYFAQKLSKNTLTEAKKIQKELQRQNFSLSLLKILAFTGTLTSTQFLEGILRCVYQIEVKVVDKSKAKKKMDLRQTMPVSRKELAKKMPSKAKTNLHMQKKRVIDKTSLGQTMAISQEHFEKKVAKTRGIPQKRLALDKKAFTQKQLDRSGKTSSTAKKPARPLPSGKLGQTMAISQEHLVKKIKDAPRAASKIMERLMRREQERKQAQKKDAQKLEPQELQPREKEKPNIVAKKISSVAMSIDEDTARVREGLAQGMISKNALFDAVMIQSAKGNKKLLEILQEENLIAKEQYAQLQVIAVTERKIDVTKPSQEIDLLFASLLLDYQIINRDQIQKMLRLQNAFACLGFHYSLGNLLIKSKTLATEMVEPLLAECERRKQEKAKASAPMPVAQTTIKPADKTNATNYAWVGAVLTMVIVTWIAWPSPEKRLKPKAFPAKHQALPIFTVNVNANNTERAKTHPHNSYSRKKNKIVTPTPKLPEISAINFSLENIAIEYREKTLLVKGQFVYDLPQKRAKNIKGSVEIWDIWKRQRRLLEDFTLSGKSFERSIATEPALANGVYYLRFATTLFDAKQNNSWEYWQPFSIGFSLREDKKIRQWGEDNFHTLDNDLVEISNQYKKLYNFCKQPMNEVEEKWEDWSDKWRKKNRKLAIRCKERKNENLLAFCKNVDNALLKLLADLESLQNSLDDWQRGLSILPPNMLFRESEFVMRQKQVDILLKQRKKSFWALLRGKPKNENN